MLSVATRNVSAGMCGVGLIRINALLLHIWFHNLALAANWREILRAKLTFDPLPFPPPRQRACTSRYFESEDIVVWHDTALWNPDLDENPVPAFYIYVKYIFFPTIPCRGRCCLANEWYIIIIDSAVDERYRLIDKYQLPRGKLRLPARIFKSKRRRN